MALPVYDSPNDDNGYDIRDYKAILPEFGTMADFDELLGEMHRRGLRLIMDMVFNHTSDEHPWFRAALADPAGPYRDFYFFRDGVKGREPNNWASHFGFSAWEKEKGGEQYFLHLYTRRQPDLNWDNPAVREALYDILAFWRDKGVDGFRFDVINYISKTPGLPAMPGPGLQLASPYFANGPRVHEYLREMHDRVLKGRDLMTVGEMVSVNTDQARLYTDESRQELDMVFTFEHMYLDCVGEDKWRLKPWTLADLKRCFGRWQKDLMDGCWNSLYLNNHDQPRLVSRFGEDTVYREKSAKMLATFLHTLRGTPFVYQGEELGMTNVRFPSLACYRDVDTLNHYQEAVFERGEDPAQVMEQIYRKGRDNARTPMQWDDSPSAGFTSGKPWIDVNPNYCRINAAAQENDPDSVLNYYRRLIALRKAYPILSQGDWEMLLEDHPAVFAYRRRYEGQELLTLLNFTGQDADVTLPPEVSAAGKRLLIGSDVCPDALTCRLTLRPYEAQVWLG
jgi:oligo-1,6-glucosidase